MRVLIEDYRNLTAGHCGSGAMRNLIYHYCGLDLEEGVVFGLGAGLDTVYFSYDQQHPPFMLFGRGSSMEADLAETLGMDYAEQIQTDCGIDYRFRDPADIVMAKSTEARLSSAEEQGELRSQ